MKSGTNRVFSLLILTLVFMIPPLSEGYGFEIYGHRGTRGLSPENTIPAYKTALSLGIDVMDMDINMTKDGILVVTHNLSLNPGLTRVIGTDQYITNSKLWIKDYTLDQLRKFDVGRLDLGSEYGRTYPDQYSVDQVAIPTLDEVIRYGKKIGGPSLRFQIEMKTDPTSVGSSDPMEMAIALKKVMVREEIVERTEVQAFDFRCMLALKKILPNATLQFLTYEAEQHTMLNPDPKIAGIWTAGYLLKDYGGSIPKMIVDLGGTVWGVEDVELTEEQIEEAKQLGLKIVVWSLPTFPNVNINVPLTEKLMDQGIDGFITDRPDILRGLIAARGLTDLPPTCTEKRPCR